MREKIEIYFDGCCEPRNPGGSMGIGIVCFRNGKLVHELSYGCIVGQNWHKPTSNNIAEYLAFKAAVKWAYNTAAEMYDLTFYGDSKLVINQMKGDWQIGEGMYVSYANEAKEELQNLVSSLAVATKFVWVPREANEPADILSKKSLTDKGIKITDRSKK